MREIKFRAWIREWEEFSYPFDDEKDGKPDSFWDWDKRNSKLVIYLRNEPKNDPCDNDYEPAEDPIIEQFTGLRDKNGTEIYEGDVVRDEYGHDFKILWNNDSALYQGLLGNNTEPLCFLHVHPIEVIGNIHDNPSLLEAK